MVFDLKDLTTANKEPTVTQLLQNVFGVGKSISIKICKSEGICKNQLVSGLDATQLEALSDRLHGSGTLIDVDLRKKLSQNFETSLSIKSYKSLRKVQGYPSRGQRTHSNAKTARKRFR